MNELTNKTALVTGGSRGLGRAIVEALAAEGVKVWAIARNEERLNQLQREVKGVQILCGDVTDPAVAAQAMRQVQPDILVINAGTLPGLGQIQDLSWEDFAGPWETDVKQTFLFGKEALLMPMKPGSTVIIVSSGAAVGGSPLSGGYAGAKRTQWFMTNYLQQGSNTLKRDIRFVALIPRQIINATELGHRGIMAYSAQQGISEQEFIERAGKPLTPERIGSSVVTLLTDEAYRDGAAYGVSSSEFVAMS